MANPVWGQLAKSQTDAEKVEEAIVRLILEHNEDETAHLGVGQSLQSHKASEIIDHLAESIIEDKIANGSVSSDKITTEQIIAKDFRTALDVGEEVDGVKFNGNGIEAWQSGEKTVEIPVSGSPKFSGNIYASGLFFLKQFLYTCWESLDCWITSGTGSFWNYFGGLTINFTSGGAGWLTSNNYANDGIDFANKNPNFQISLRVRDANYSQIYFGCGGLNTVGLGRGFGFHIDDGGNITAFVCNDAEEYTEVLISGINETAWHVYRAEMISLDRVDFYIDNVLVASIPYDVDTFPATANPITFTMLFNGVGGSRAYYSRYLAVCQDL